MKTLKIQVECILICPRATAITCSSYIGHKFCTREKFQDAAVALTDLPVVIKERVSSRAGEAYYNGNKTTASSIHPKQFLTNKSLNNLT